jgi:hypothetical protein
LIANRRLRADFVRNIDDRRTQIVHRAILVGRNGRARRFSRHQFLHVIGNAMEFLRSDYEIDVRKLFQ